MVRKADLVKKIAELEKKLDEVKGGGSANPHVLWLVETAETCLRAASVLSKYFEGAFPDGKPAKEAEHGS